MGNKTKLVIFSILTILWLVGCDFAIIYCFGVNFMLGIMSLFLISATGYFYKKAYAAAKDTGSKLALLFAKYILPMLILVTIGLALLFDFAWLPSLIG